MVVRDMTASGGRRARAAATEAALKAAATTVFEERGYLNTKITDITAAAGRAAGSFYNHFASKEELLESLLADLFTEGDEAVAKHPPDHDLSDPTQLRWHIAGFWQIFQRHSTVFVALQQAAMLDGRFAERLRALVQPEQRVMREHLEYLRDRGVRLPGDPSVVAAAMTAMWYQFAYGQLAGGMFDLGRRLSDDEAVDTLTAFTLRGLAGDVPDTGSA
ncbi:MAG: TetR/AcrR family transcriptional regulator [Actinocatenispora sp.]